MYQQLPFNVMPQQQQSPATHSSARPAESIPAELASMYKRDKDGQLLWFAGPPVHVTATPQPVHSVAYLEWKRKQQQQ